MRHGVFVLPIDGRRTGAPHGTLLASPRAAAPRRHMLYLRRYCHIICTIGHEVPPRIEVRLQDLHERGSVTAPVLRAANTCFDGLDGRRRRRPGARRRPSIARRPTSRVCALCGNQNFTARSESSRRPPRHRRDARSMAWRCGLSPLDSASTAAFSPREDLVKNCRTSTHCSFFTGRRIRGRHV